MRILLTGATGLLGRHVVFELLMQNWQALDTLQIFVLGRGQNELDIRERIENIVLNEGPDYLSRMGTTASIKAKIATFLRHNLIVLESDLSVVGMGLSDFQVRQLRDAQIDEVFHIAGNTDFRDTLKTSAALETNIVQGTLKMLALSKRINAGNFNYVSTAYVCGSDVGVIDPAIVSAPATFRNYYERMKVRAEQSVRAFADETGMVCRIFRPSVICGRMMEGTVGWTSKFDVFYGWASFFLRETRRSGEKNNEREPVRIMCHPTSGLNIVPVDYCAKLMLAVCRAAPGGTYHLVNEENVPHTHYIPMLMSAVGFGNFKLVSEEPADRTPLEQQYYRTVGVMFEGYFCADAIHFDTQNTAEIRAAAALDCPVLQPEGFKRLMPFAIEHSFGLQPNLVSDHVGHSGVRGVSSRVLSQSLR